MTTLRGDGTPHPLDISLGRNIRLRRKSLGMSQSALGEAVGLTFQQVQKYERGLNRVSASKLYDIARTLRASIPYFFEGLASPETINRSDVFEPDSAEFLYDLVMTPEGLELAALFPRIERRHRRLVLEMARVLAGESPIEANVD